MPLSSVTVDWTPTRPGLRASTVTPGSTPPWESLIVPSIDPPLLLPRGNCRDTQEEDENCAWYALHD